MSAMSTEERFLSFFNEWNLKKIHALDADISEVYETSDGLNFNVKYAPNISVLVTLPVQSGKRNQVSFRSKITFLPDDVGVLFFLNVLKNTRKDVCAFEEVFNIANRR